MSLLSRTDHLLTDYICVEFTVSFLKFSVVPTLWTADCHKVFLIKKKLCL